MAKVDVSAIRKAAREAGDQRARMVFRMRAIELGGVNPKTRPIIEHEVMLSRRQAMEDVYLAHGYSRCAAFDGTCGRLASPGYVECPSHD